MLPRLVDYMTTPLRELPWWHAFFWGMVFGFGIGCMSAVIVAVL